jgi:hypothetical protein
MKKLEDIQKKQIFSVPEGYFEKLPAIIQTRVSSEGEYKIKGITFRLALYYTLPVIIILIASIFWLYPLSQHNEVETLISNIETEDLITYLNNEDLSTNEILESIDLSSHEIEKIESQAYQLNISDKELLYESEYY